MVGKEGSVIHGPKLSSPPWGIILLSEYPVLEGTPGEEQGGVGQDSHPPRWLSEQPSDMVAREEAYLNQ